MKRRPVDRLGIHRLLALPAARVGGWLAWRWTGLQCQRITSDGDSSGAADLDLYDTLDDW